MVNKQLNQIKSKCQTSANQWKKMDSKNDTDPFVSVHWISIICLANIWFFIDDRVHCHRCVQFLSVGPLTTFISMNTSGFHVLLQITTDVKLKLICSNYYNFFFAMVFT